MRKDEEECKAAFHTFLASTQGLEDIRWYPGDEPPDYYVFLDRTKYAVEVTTAMEQINLKSKTMSHLAFRSTVCQFLKEVEQEALLSAILTGAYSVRFKPLDSFGKLRRQIKKGINEYLCSTQNDSSAPAKTIIGKGHSRCEIIKHHSDL